MQSMKKTTEVFETYPVKVGIKLSDTRAWAMAQFFKRVDLGTYQQWAAEQDEANLMGDAGEWKTGTDLFSSKLNLSRFTP